MYVQTVVSKNAAGKLVMRGLYIGDDAECFEQGRGAEPAGATFVMMDREIKKAVVFLDPHEFKSTWLGNKSVYRTRMALADNAELIVLAPGVHEFGEDPTIDKLIRQVWVLRDAGDAGGGEGGSGAGGQPVARRRI